MLIGEDAGPLIMCGTFQKVKWKDATVSITPSQFRLIKVLVEEAGRPVKTAKIRERILSPAAADDTVRVTICAIKKAFREIDQSFDRICSVSNLGYLWRTE